MKYIITENRLNSIIFKYLDVKYGALEQKKGKYVDIVFHFPGEEFGVLGWKKSGVLYVYYKIRDEILLSIKRAGASIILTYFAKEFALSKK